MKSIIMGILMSAGLAFSAQANDVNCTPFQADMTVFAAKEHAWLGSGVLSLQGLDDITGSISATATPLELGANGGYSGVEEATFTRDIAAEEQGGGSFKVELEFQVGPETPGTQQYHGEGNIVDGTGLFQGVFGRIHIRGPIYRDDKSAVGYLKANGSMCREN